MQPDTGRPCRLATGHPAGFVETFAGHHRRAPSLLGGSNSRCHGTRRGRWVDQPPPAPVALYPALGSESATP